MNRRSRMIKAKSVGLVCAVLLLFLAFPSSARSEDPGKGYDENTEATITGKVTGVSRGLRGPVMVKVSRNGKTYEVVTGPPWFLIQEGLNFEPGLEIEVTGSRVLDRDGVLYIVARRVRDLKKGREVLFRDDSLRPVWGGKGRPFVTRPGA
jgi:hypothetical protein